MKKLDFLNREQLGRIHRLGSVRNANRILKELSPYLSSFREEYDSTVYFLNKEGREYIKTNKVRRKNKFVKHTLMRNDFYIFAGYPHKWKNEMKITDSVHTVVCDAWFEKGGKFHALEVDSTQKMNTNRGKIEKYKGLLSEGALTKHLGYFPSLIWLTTTELRRKQLTELCNGLPYRIFTVDDIR